MRPPAKSNTGCSNESRVQMKQIKKFNVIILGGGIAGMTAAIFAARANLKTVILEEAVCGGLANWTHSIENFPSHISINGMELMERVLSQVENLGVEVDQAVEIERLSLGNELKTVETESFTYTGDAVILATGRQPIRLDLDIDSERVHSCAVCDGSAYIGKRVLVVGGGNSAFDETLYLLSLGIREIVIVEALDHCCAGGGVQKRVRRRDNVEIKNSTRVKAVEQETGLCRVTLENTATGKIEETFVDGVFVFIGQRPNTWLFSGHVDLDPDGYVVTSPNMETSLSGVFAAGDVVRKTYRYLTTAMADGSIAAMRAERYIREAREG